jgi:hypothetical protein
MKIAVDKYLSMEDATKITVHKRPTDEHLEVESGDYKVDVFENDFITPNPAIPIGYYVDFTGGLDSNDGLTPETAWKTVDKINTEAAAGTFVAGNTIHFKRGEVWDDQLSLSSVSGALRNPIIFCAYGSGANPVIQYITGVDGASLFLYATTNLLFYDLHFKDGLEYCAYINEVIDVTFSSCIFEMTSDQTRSIYVVGSPVTKDSSVKFEYCTISTTTGVTNNNGGIYSGLSNISVNGCYFSNLGSYSIWIGVSATEMFVQHIIDSTFVDCGALFVKSGMGGGTESGLVKGCTFIRSKSLSITGHGGIEFIGSTHAYYLAPFYIIGCVFIDPTLGEAGYNAISISYFLNITVKNCIFLRLGASATYRFFVAAYNSDDVTNYNFNYNCFYNDAGTNRFRTIIDSVGVDYSSLASWQAATGYEANSIANDPLFTDGVGPDYDLTLQAGSPCHAVGEGGVDMGLYPNG